MTRLILRTVRALALVLPFLLVSASVSAAEPCFLLPADPATVELQATPSADSDSPLLGAPTPTPTACICGVGGTTPPDVALSWGMGATCAAATANLDANTQQLADELCVDAGAKGACSFGPLQISTACYITMGQYQVDGYRTYKCLRCINPHDP